MIEIYPRSVANQSRGRERDIRRNGWNFITLHPSTPLVIKHEIKKEWIGRAGVQKGEKHKIKLMNKGLGTRCWCWADLSELEGKEFRWPGREGHFYGKWDEDREKMKQEEKEGVKWIVGEDEKEVGIVVERGVVEFDTV